MSTEIKMITPEDCKISYSEFKEICFKNMKSALEEWKNEKIEDRDGCIRIWNHELSHYLYKKEYLEMLKEELSKEWKNFKVEHQLDEKTDNVYICLYL